MEHLKEFIDSVNILTSSALTKGNPDVISEEQAKFIYTELIPGVAKRCVQVKTKNIKFRDLVADTITAIGNLFNSTI